MTLFKGHTEKVSSSASPHYRLLCDSCRSSWMMMWLSGDCWSFNRHCQERLPLLYIQYWFYSVLAFRRHAVHLPFTFADLAFIQFRSCRRSGQAMQFTKLADYSRFIIQPPPPLSRYSALLGSASRSTILLYISRSINNAMNSRGQILWLVGILLLFCHATKRPLHDLLPGEDFPQANRQTFPRSLLFIAL